jgi:hypothetical protein
MNPYSVILGVAAVVVVLLEFTEPIRQQRRSKRVADSLDPIFSKRS